MNGTGPRDVRASLQPVRPGAVGPIEKARDSGHALARLLPYLRPYAAGLGLVFCCIVIATVSGLLGPYLLGMAIDRHIAVRIMSGLPLMALWMLAAYLLSNLFQTLADWIMAHVSQRVLGRLRQDLFAHMQNLPLGYFDSRPVGELMSRLTNDIDAINQAVSQNVTSLFASVLSLAGILAAMFMLDRWLAVASLLVAPIMFWFTGFVARSTRQGFRDLQRHLGGLNSVMEEAISGQKVIKAFRRGESVLASFRDQNQKVYKTALRANSYALLLMPLTGVLGNFFVIVLAGLGGWLALHSLVSVGTIATFIVYGQNFIQPLRQLANMYNTIQAALAGAERIFEIIDTPAEVDEADSSSPGKPVRGLVRFEDVEFAYTPGNPVIRKMSLEARPGQMIALVGPTGAGKTTIINLLTRFYEINRGRISIDGIDIRTIPKARLRRGLGLVLQDTFLFAGTVMENIRYGRLEATDDECIRAARLADADHFILQLPQGYQTDLSERAGNLSNGQRQLLAIARAILADPGILILDEATSSVDSRTEVRIQTALLRLMQGRTSFVIAHRLSTIRDADRVLVVERGEIVEQGSHEELLARRGFYHHLYLSQFKGEQI
ncbi:MAG: ABC transporter ATP-binding protein [Desulfocapsaceae bacterium]|nr:ABC transporter ATP-binding protein [Desulfocapsaceae bacterium]